MPCPINIKLVLLYKHNDASLALGKSIKEVIPIVLGEPLNIIKHITTA